MEVLEPFYDESKKKVGLIDHIGSAYKKILERVETTQQVDFRIEKGRISCNSTSQLVLLGSSKR